MNNAEILTCRYVPLHVKQGCTASFNRLPGLFLVIFLLNCNFPLPLYGPKTKTTVQEKLMHIFGCIQAKKTGSVTRSVPFKTKVLGQQRL